AVFVEQRISCACETSPRRPSRRRSGLANGNAELTLERRGRPWIDAEPGSQKPCVGSGSARQPLTQPATPLVAIVQRSEVVQGDAPFVAVPEQRHVQALETRPRRARPARFTQRS